MVGSLQPAQDGTQDTTNGQTNGQAIVGAQVTEEGMFVCLSNHDKNVCSCHGSRPDTDLTRNSGCT